MGFFSSFKKTDRSRSEILTEAFFFQLDSMGSCTGLGKVELTAAHVAGIIQKRASC